MAADDSAGWAVMAATAIIAAAGWIYGAGKRSGRDDEMRADVLKLDDKLEQEVRLLTHAVQALDVRIARIEESLRSIVRSLDEIKATK